MLVWTIRRLLSSKAEVSSIGAGGIGAAASSLPPSMITPPPQPQAGAAAHPQDFAAHPPQLPLQQRKRLSSRPPQQLFLQRLFLQQLFAAQPHEAFAAQPQEAFAAQPLLQRLQRERQRLFLQQLFAAQPQDAFAAQPHDAFAALPQGFSQHDADLAAQPQPKPSI